MAKIISIGCTQSGLNRKVNEDTFSTVSGVYPEYMTGFEEKAGSSDQPFQIYSLTDGFGGPGVGDIAGRVVQRVAQTVFEASRMEEPFQELASQMILSADRAVQRQLDKYKGLPIGCSFSALVIWQNAAYTVSNGSNRIWLFRDGELYQVTEDNLTLKGQPVSYIGFRPDRQPLRAENMNCIRLKEGDILLLTTDGCHQAVEADRIEQVFNQPNSFADQVRTLVKQLDDAQSMDNQTLVALRIQSLAAAVRPSSPVYVNQSQQQGRPPSDARPESSRQPASLASQAPAATVNPDLPRRQIDLHPDQPYRTVQRRPIDPDLEQPYRAADRRRADEYADQSYRAADRRRADEYADQPYRAADRRQADEYADQPYRAADRRRADEYADQPYRAADPRRADEYTDQPYRAADRRRPTAKSETRARRMSNDILQQKERRQLTLLKRINRILFILGGLILLALIALWLIIYLR